MQRESPVSAWSPLRHAIFKTLWIAAVVSNVGTWMHNVGAVWLMGSLTVSPMMVALIQTATSLPFFLLALPAGALADVMDRRGLLLGTQTWMLTAAAGLGLLTLFDMTTPWVLLTFTFLLGIGAALNSPAWQAMIPDLVPRAELSSAVTLSGVAFNVARAVGPALGGLLVALTGASTVFLLNAASFVGVLIALCRWRALPRSSRLPAEHVVEAMRTGLRYVRYAPAFHAVLVQAGVFIISGSALWALLPLVAQHELRLGAMGYGALLGCLGLGAIVSVPLLPHLRLWTGTESLVAGAIILFAVVTAAVAFLRTPLGVGIALFGGGIAWMALLSSLNTAAHMAIPSWVRARGLAIYTLVFLGGTAAGSALWGLVATLLGTSVALACAAVGQLMGLLITTRYSLTVDTAVDLTPSRHWPEPTVVEEPPPEAGPVLVTVEYDIDPAHVDAFVQAMQAVRLERRRDGATRWELWGDPAYPGRYIEMFTATSWVEHLRQHERVTMADRDAEARAAAFRRSSEPLRIAHLLAAPRPTSEPVPCLDEP